MKPPVRLKTSSYNKYDIIKIIIDNKLHCECCNKMFSFNVDCYAIEHSINSGPLLKLECQECDIINDFHIFNLKRPIPHEEGDDNMCYTGKCKYERGGGDYVGECTLNCKSGEYPDDAHCIEQNLLMEEEELLNNYYKQINQGNQSNQKDIDNDPFDFDDFDLDEGEN